jgi:hypothetical protein
MPLPVENNETLDPIEICLLGPKGIVFEADNFSNTFEKFGLAGVWDGG